MKLTNKERAIREFAQAMRMADSMHMYTMENMTLHMAEAWYEYIAACEEEVKRGKPSR